MVREEDAETRLLREWRDVQIWRIIYRPLPHKRAEAASYVVQVIGHGAETFRLPSAAWRRFTSLCAEKQGRPPRAST